MISLIVLLFVGGALAQEPDSGAEFDFVVSRVLEDPAIFNLTMAREDLGTLVAHHYRGQKLEQHVYHVPVDDETVHVYSCLMRLKRDLTAKRCKSASGEHDGDTACVDYSRCHDGGLFIPRPPPTASSLAE